MIKVSETWRLKPEFAQLAIEIMQEMDDLVGPNAHGDPGWSGHAKFLQSAADPAKVLVVYRWRSREEHERLAASERPLLAAFQDKYCAAPREIQYYTEIPVDADHGRAYPADEKTR